MTERGDDPRRQPLTGTARAFRPGKGAVVLVLAGALVLVLALSAALLAALGARAASGVLGGSALVIVGLGLLTVLRVPARSLRVNAPRLRLERHRSRMAHRTERDPLPPMAVPGTDLVIPPSSGDRELTSLDVVSGPVTSLVVSTPIGRAADRHLAGTTTGEGLLRVAQLLAGTVGFMMVALGLASILRQVWS